MNKALNYNAGRFDWKTQSVGEGENSMPVSRIISQIERGYYNTREFNLHLDSYNLASTSFECNDLFDFLTHYKLTSRASLEYPVIMNDRGEVIDGRHRICKAILLGKKKIKCIQILDSTVI